MLSILLVIVMALTLGGACSSSHDQLCGRTGRDGRASRAHVFMSSGQKSSEQVRLYFTSKENCRRRMMLLAVGASESHPEGLPCCDSCDMSKCPKSVCFESHFILALLTCTLYVHIHFLYVTVI